MFLDVKQYSTSSDCSLNNDNRDNDDDKYDILSFIIKRVRTFVNYSLRHGASTQWRVKQYGRQKNRNINIIICFVTNNMRFYRFRGIATVQIVAIIIY